MWNVDTDYCGHPFGGVFIICKSIKGLSFHELQTGNDSCAAVGVYDSSGNLVQIWLCVYMPFYTGDACQTQKYIPVIDALQAVLDKNGTIKNYGWYECQDANQE